MRVRKKDHIEARNIFQHLRALRICHYPRIDQRYLAGRSCQRKRGVTEISQLVALHVEHGALRGRECESFVGQLDWGGGPAAALAESRVWIADSNVSRFPAPI